MLPFVKPTHVLALPLGQHALLRARVTAFTNALCAAGVPGVHTGLAVAPRRLRFHLAGLVLAPPDVARARMLLTALRPRLLALGRTRAPLGEVNIMRPEGKDPRRSHAVYVSPTPRHIEGDALWAVAQTVREEFRAAGFLQFDEGRALTLRATLLTTKTKYRAPARDGDSADPAPFDFLALLASPAFAAIRAGPSPSWLAGAMAPGARVKAKAVPVDFGTWDVDEVQLCEVSPSGYVGDYVSAGRVSLVPDMMGYVFPTANTRPISLV